MKKVTFSNKNDIVYFEKNDPIIYLTKNSKYYSGSRINFLKYIFIMGLIGFLIYYFFIRKV